jgi:hypothetical protein
MGDLRLFEAVKSGNLTQIIEEIESNAPVNQQDEHGWTPLNWAAGGGNLKIVKLLLDRGADVSIAGRDRRTPYDIALAAGHAEVAKILAQAENLLGERKIERPRRVYCKAYYLKDLRQFLGFPGNSLENGQEKHSSDGDSAGIHDKAMPDDEIAYLHEDFTVTKSIWRDENIIFDQVTSEWKAFCIDALKFEIPDDLDLSAKAVI